VDFLDWILVYGPLKHADGALDPAIPKVRSAEP